MLTQRQMKRSKHASDVDNSIIKRNKLKDAHVTFVKCGCGAGLHSFIKRPFKELVPTWEEQVDQEYSKDLRKKQAIRREEERLGKMPSI